MKYSLNINLEKLYILSPELDIVDASILDYVYYLCSSQNEKISGKRVTNETGNWTWVDFKTLIAELPYLKINCKSSVSRRITKLSKAGFISSINHKNFKTYVKIEPKIDHLFTSDSSVALKQRQRSSKATLALLQSNIDSNTIDSNTNDSKLTTNVVNWGNPDINAGICLLKESGITTSKEKLNRYALQRLYKKHGIDKTLGVMKYALAVRGQPYAPIITSYLDLESKWDKLEAFGVRQKNERRQHGAIDASDL